MIEFDYHAHVAQEAKETLTRIAEQYGYKLYIENADLPTGKRLQITAYDINESWCFSSNTSAFYGSPYLEVLRAVCARIDYKSRDTIERALTLIDLNPYTKVVRFEPASENGYASLVVYKKSFKSYYKQSGDLLIELISDYNKQPSQNTINSLRELARNLGKIADAHTENTKAFNNLKETLSYGDVARYARENGLHIICAEPTSKEMYRYSVYTEARAST